MFGHTFQWGTTRKYVSLFGSIVNDLTVVRSDSEGSIKKSVKVPLSYGPKERYLAKLRQSPDDFREINQVLPRMSFEMKGLTYDPSRKLNTLLKTTKTLDAATRTSQYAPVPYNYSIELWILARNYDDALQVVEQILPFFTPAWTSTVSLLPDVGYDPFDISIVLNNVQVLDTYEGPPASPEFVMWTLGFTLKGWIFGPTKKIGVIKEVDLNFYVPATNTAAEGIGITSVAETVVIKPGLTVNGQPTSNAAASISSSLITADDDYGFIIDFGSNL